MPKKKYFWHFSSIYFSIHCIPFGTCYFSAYRLVKYWNRLEEKKLSLLSIFAFYAIKIRKLQIVQKKKKNEDICFFFFQIIDILWRYEAYVNKCIHYECMANCFCLCCCYLIFVTLIHNLSLNLCAACWVWLRKSTTYGHTSRSLDVMHHILLLLLLLRLSSAIAFCHSFTQSGHENCFDSFVSLLKWNFQPNRKWEWEWDNELNNILYVYGIYLECFVWFLYYWLKVLPLIIIKYSCCQCGCGGCEVENCPWIWLLNLLYYGINLFIYWYWKQFCFRLYSNTHTQQN